MRLFQPPGRDGDAAAASQQGVDHRPRRAARTQHQTIPTIEGQAIPLQIGQKAGPVGIEASQTAVADDDGVNRADDARGGENGIHMRQDGLFVGHGHVDAAKAEGDQATQGVGQEFRGDGQRHVGSVET